MMTKRNFENIAAEIKARVDEADSFEPAAGFDEGHTAGYLNALTELAEGLCVYFKRDNPNFKKGTFLKACGID